MTALTIALVATGLIVLGLSIAFASLTRLIRTLSREMATETNRATNKFIRDLDASARQHANTTNEAYAQIVLDKIQTHFEHVGTLQDKASERAAKKFEGK